MTTRPDVDDVIVRQTAGRPSTVYLLGTPAGADQLRFHSRADAVLSAVAFARAQQVRAWFTTDDEEFVLLGTFRATDPAHMLPQMTIQRCDVCGGALVAPDILRPRLTRSPHDRSPDYLCIECQQPHYWRGVPPRLCV